MTANPETAMRDVVEFLREDNSENRCRVARTYISLIFTGTFTETLELIEESHLQAVSQGLLKELS